MLSCDQCFLFLRFAIGRGSRTGDAPGCELPVCSIVISPWTDRLFQWWRAAVGAAVPGPCGRTLQTPACFADTATNGMCRSGEFGPARPRANQQPRSLTLNCRFPRDGNEKSPAPILSRFTAGLFGLLLLSQYGRGRQGSMKPDWPGGYAKAR
jgi:hypothetical protein